MLNSYATLHPCASSWVLEYEAAPCEPLAIIISSTTHRASTTASPHPARAKTRYRLIFNGSSEAVLMLKAANLRIVEANPAAIGALGLALLCPEMNRFTLP